MAQSSRIAIRRASSVHHVVTGVPRWHAGMLEMTVCGTRNADVREDEAKRDDPLLCKRCKHSLGWDLPVRDRPTRGGGWPGPRKPKWSFRPTPEAEAAVASYIERHGLDPERDRSQAINALLAQPASPETESVSQIKRKRGAST